MITTPQSSASTNSAIGLKFICLDCQQTPWVDFCIGAKNGTRTRDPDLGKVVLYQLSYFRELDAC